MKIFLAMLMVMIFGSLTASVYTSKKDVRRKKNREEMIKKLRKGKIE